MNELDENDYSYVVDDPKITCTFQKIKKIITHNFSGLILSQSGYGYSGMIMQTASVSGPPEDSAVLFVGSDKIYSASNAPFYVRRDGFFKATTGEIGGWNVDNFDMYSDSLLTQKVVFTAFNQDGLPSLFSGMYMSSSYAGYSGFVTRNSAGSTTPFFFINSPVLYDVGAAFPKVADGNIWMKADGTLVAQHIIASQSLIASCSIYCSADIYAEDDIVAFSDERLKKDIIQITICCSSFRIFQPIRCIRFER